MIIFNTDEDRFEIWDSEDTDDGPKATIKLGSYATKEEAWAVERAMWDAPPLEMLN